MEQRLSQLSEPKLLSVGEFDYLLFEAAAAHLLFQLVSRRYERGSILITSNRAVPASTNAAFCSGPRMCSLTSSDVLSSRATISARLSTAG